jgi:hypothetical protein
MKVKVLKAFVVEGKMLEVGSIVDATSWRNVKTLEGSRYIAPVYYTSENETKTESKPSAPKKA